MKESRDDLPGRFLDFPRFGTLAFYHRGGRMEEDAMKGHAVFWTVVVALGVAVALAYGPGCVHAEQPRPVWTGDPQWRGDLAAEVGLPTFRIRPPRGYTLIEQPGPGGARAFAWKGATRADGTAPYVMVTIATAPPGETKMPTLEAALDTFLDGVRRRRVDWLRTPGEVGQVNGLTFIRARWSGIEPNSGVRMHGFMYIAIDGRNIIQLSSQDVEPHHDRALRLAEASALTFNKP